jgi:hypothetical protein
VNLVELLNIANAGYPDQSLSLLYDHQTGEMLDAPEKWGDTLAVFIVRELTETFEPTNASDVQLAAAASAMERAALEVAGVFGALKSALDQT